MYRSYKYLMQPTARQGRMLEDLLEIQRELYNAALQERREAWARKRKSVSRFDQFAQLSDVRAMREDVARYGVNVARGTLIRLDRSFNAFYRRCRQGQSTGYPRFKPRSRFTTISYEDHSSSWKLNEQDRRLYMQGVGHVKVRLHRRLQGVAKTCHVRQEGRRWWVVVQCADVPARALPSTGRVGGFDLGVANLLASSDGQVVPNPRHGRSAAARLARVQQDLTRKKKGSARRRVAVERVRACHRRIAARRRDTLHKLSRHLVECFDVLVFEDLRITNMTRSARGNAKAPGTNVAAKAGLNREILAAGWGELLTMVVYKAEEAGRDVVLVEPRNTSRTCQECGHVAQKNRLQQAVFRCCECGREAHADVNAATNILRAGLAQRREKREAETCV